MVFLLLSTIVSAATRFPAGCNPEGYITNVVRMGVSGGIGVFDKYLEECYQGCYTVNPAVSGSSQYWDQVADRNGCTIWPYKRVFYYEAALAYVDYLDEYLSDPNNQQQISQMENFDIFYYDVMPTEYELSDLIYTKDLVGVQANPYHAYDMVLSKYGMKVPQSYIDAHFGTLASADSDIEHTTVRNEWFPYYTSKRENIIDILNQIKEAKKPAQSELGEEWESMNQEKNKILDDIEALCNSIKGCEPTDRERSEFIEDIIGQIIDLHDESCEKGTCMSLPLKETIVIMDRVVDWNARQQELERRSKEMMKAQGVQEYTNQIQLDDDIMANLRSTGSKEITAVKVDTKDSLVIKGFASVQLSEDALATGIKSFNAKIASADQGEKVTVSLPQESSVKTITGTAAKPLKDMTMEITTINEQQLNQALPILGGKGLIGNQDYIIPDMPIAPPKKFDIQEYFKVDTGAEKPFSSAEFTYTTQETKKAKLLRYDEEKKQWTELPTQFDKCELGLCTYTSTSPGTSYFAIVIEKESNTVYMLLRILLLISMVYGAYILISKIKTEKRAEGIKNVILKIFAAAAIFIVILFITFILLIIIGLFEMLIGWATRTTFPGAGTIYLILNVLIYLGCFWMIRLTKKETFLGFGPRFWLITASIFLVYTILTDIHVILELLNLTRWFPGIMGGVIGGGAVLMAVTMMKKKGGKK